MDLNDIVVFARVVQAGSFTQAAKDLGMPKSTVSRKVAELEERLHSRLLQRTTRRLSLTDAGRTYYAYCSRIVAEVEEAELAVSRLEETPRGRLRVTAPLNFAFLGPIVGEYLRRFPEVQVELACTDRVVDLVEERFDLGIRAGNLADSTLIARSLGSAGWLLVATPGYLKKRGTPRAPEELARHDCLLFGTNAERVSLRMTSGEQTQEVSIMPRLFTNDSDMLHAAAVEGVGIARLPVFHCQEELRKKRLVRVLVGWELPLTPIHAVYASTRHVSPKLKSFLDHLQARLTPPPWEQGPKE
jgi:DNA-binding transcriptional LysR family regulator